MYNLTTCIYIFYSTFFSSLGLMLKIIQRNPSKSLKQDVRHVQCSWHNFLHYILGELPPPLDPSISPTPFDFYYALYSTLQVN